MCRGKGKVSRGLTHPCSPCHGLASGHILYIATVISVRPSATTTIQQGHTVNFGGQFHPPSHQNRNFCSASPLTTVQMNGATISGADRISMMCLTVLCNMCRYTNRNSWQQTIRLSRLQPRAHKFQGTQICWYINYGQLILRKVSKLLPPDVRYRLPLALGLCPRPAG